MSPPESVRNGSSIYSMSKYASKKSVTKDVVDFDDDEDDDNDASDGPFLPKRAAQIDDSFDVVFEESNKKSDCHFDDTTSGGIVFEDDSNAAVENDVSNKSKFFLKDNGNQSSAENSGSQVIFRRDTSRNM